MYYMDFYVLVVCEFFEGDMVYGIWLEQILFSDVSDSCGEVFVVEYFGIMQIVIIKIVSGDFKVWIVLD